MTETNSTLLAEASHTPGPWVVDGLTVESVSGGNICLLNLARQKSATNANARLVAAAPDLLAACRASWDLGHKIYHNANAHEADLDWRMVRKLLQTAFDKVEGKS